MFNCFAQSHKICSKLQKTEIEKCDCTGQQVNYGMIDQQSVTAKCVKLKSIHLFRDTKRMSKRYAYMISSRFPGVSRRHFDYNPVDFAMFLNPQINNLNKEACDDRPHPMPISVMQPLLMINTYT